MLLKEMIMETGIDEILDIYYEYFEESNVDRFLKNLERLLEVDYAVSVESDREIHFNIYQSSKKYDITACFIEDGPCAIYSIPPEELLNMKVYKPKFLDDSEILCIIIDDALSA